MMNWNARKATQDKLDLWRLCAAGVTQNGETGARRLFSDNIMPLHKITVDFQEKQIQTHMDWYIIAPNKNRHANRK